MGNSRSYDFTTSGLSKMEKFERNLTGLNQGVGYYWVTDGTSTKSGIVIIK